MINSIVFNSNKKSHLNDLKSLVYKVSLGCRVLSIKNYLNFFSINELMHFLKKEMNYILDRRHFDYESNSAQSDWWTIAYDPEKDKVYTYSKTRQPLHTDNSWFSVPAEMNFFYMEKQVEKGGENTFYPIDRLKTDLQKENPALLNDLENIKVIIQKGEGEDYNETSIIDDNKIYWNFYRTVKDNNDINNMCNHFFEYLGKKERTNSVEVFKSHSGDIFCFNDLTILHGRLSYNAKIKNDRILHQSMWKIA